MRTKFIDRIGEKYGHLTIQDYLDGRYYCVCECGAYHLVKPSNLLLGMVKSCGKTDCKYAHSLRVNSHTKHGESKTRLYSIWNDMIGRCYRTNTISYPNYGARGIRICEEWRYSFESFRDWALSNGYENHLTIDRIDVNGDYTPSNCRWATVSEQNRNQRPHKKHKLHKNCVMWEIDGVTKSWKEWCTDYGMLEQTVRYRVLVKGMSPRDALTVRQSHNGRPRKEC